MSTQNDNKESSFIQFEQFAQPHMILLHPYIKRRAVRFTNAALVQGLWIKDSCNTSMRGNDTYNPQTFTAT